MSDRYKDNFRNTDNEDTHFFAPPSDDLDTAEFSRPQTNAPQYRNPSPRPQQGQYGNPNPRPQQGQYGNPNPRPQQGQYGNPNPRPQQGQYGNPNPRPQQGQYGNARLREPVSRDSYYDSSSPINRRPHTQSNAQQSPRQSAPNRNYGQDQQLPPPQRQGQRPPQQGQRPPRQGQPQRKKASPEPKQTAPKKRKKRRKMPFIVKLLITLLIIAALIFGAYSFFAMSVIKKINYVESVPFSHSSSALSESYVRSILLVGTDGRSADERGRSDTMILLSMNSKTDEITLTSIMRDSYVEVPGHGMDKLTNAYSYGGIDLLMETIERNFDVRVDDYISVNFNSFAAIVDAVGGIDLDVSDAEAGEINVILQAEVNQLMGDAVDSDLLSSGGKLHLSGKQALSYARIRHIGNADFERTQRQRTVLTEIAGKLKSSGIKGIRTIADTAVPQMTTNMTKKELYLLSLKLPFLIGDDIKQLRLPAEKTYSGESTSAGSVLRVDFDANRKILEEEVFSDN